jgi:hypothetical protein
MDRQSGRSDPVEVVAAAIAALGEDTAANIAARAGMAYSTVTPKLRALEDAGRAERVKRDGRTLWQLTADATTQDHTARADTSGDAAAGPAGHGTAWQDNTPPGPVGQPPGDPTRPRIRPAPPWPSRPARAARPATTTAGPASRRPPPTPRRPRRRAAQPADLRGSWAARRWPSCRPTPAPPTRSASWPS